MTRQPLAALVLIAGLTALPACQAPVASRAVETATGSVSVHVELPRRVAAVAADIDRISLRLVNINQVPYTFERTLDRAAIEAGQDVTFTGLVLYSHELFVKAYDANGRVIGQTRDFLNPSATEVPRRTVRLTLEPTYSQPAATTGDVTTEVQFPDLPPAGALVATYPSPLEYGWRLVGDHAGAIWAAENHRLVKFGPDGQVLVDKTFAGNLQDVYDMAVDSQDNLWVLHLDRLRKYDSAGVELATSEVYGGRYQFVIDSQDNLWAPGVNGCDKYASDGTLIGRYRIDIVAQGHPLGAGASSVQVDEANGIVWVRVDAMPDHRLLKFSLDGDYLGDGPPGLYTNDYNLALHPDGHLWAYAYTDHWSQGFQFLTRIAPDGATTRTPAGIWCGELAFDQAGNTWLARGTEFNNLYKMSATGTPIGVLTLPSNNGSIATAADGTLWVHGQNALFKIAP